jgi:hypothetical protein
MKPSLVCLVLLPLCAAAAETAPLAFPEPKLEVPSFSLTAGALQDLPACVSALHRGVGDAPGTSRLVSRMPVVEPGQMPDAKMVKAPDPTVDARLIVRVPAVESLNTSQIP